MTDTVTKVKFTANKAIWGAVLAGIIAALGVVATDVSAGADWSNIGTYLGILLAGLAGAGITGTGVYNATNKPVPAGNG